MKNFKSIKYLTIAFASLFLVSCTSEEKEKTIDGVYQSIGYGHIVKIIDGNYLMADVTSISCMPIMDGEISDFGDNLHYKNDTLSLKYGINTYYYTRIGDAPTICQKESEDYKNAQAKANDPEYNFEVLWKTFEDHYAYFDLRRIDSEKMYTTYRPRVTAKTTDAELFLILSEMLDKFNDGHISISAPDEVEEKAFELLKERKKDESVEDTKAAKKKLRKHYVADMVAEKNIPNGKSARNGMLRWGTLERNVGYLQVNQMMGLANFGLSDTLSYGDYWSAYFEQGEDDLSHALKELEGLNEILDRAMETFKNTKALIIDIRFNGGGIDEVGMEVLKRLNGEEKVVFTKKGKTDSGYSPASIVYQPAVKNPYNKPVFLLISSESASATEIMTLSSLSLPNVTRIGSTTEGVFSDILDKSLPNGWEFGLSNEVYLDTQGNNYEGIGIAPDVSIDYPRDTQEFLHRIMEDLEHPNGDQSIYEARKLIENEE